MIRGMGLLRRAVMRGVVVVSLVLALGIPITAFADAPHVATTSTPDTCSMCHRAHTAPADFGRLDADSWEMTSSALAIAVPVDEGDTALSGWTIMVYGPGIPGGIATLVTDGTGYASIEVTAAGLYTVEEQMQEGWCAITPAVQYATVLSGYVDPAVVMFGNFECVTVTLFKYEDVDSNGVFDGDDVPLPGWTFYLESIFGRESFYVVTGPDGTVQVTFCSSDMWIVTEEDRDGWCKITPEEDGYAFWAFSGVVFNYMTGTEQYWYEFGNFRCVEIVVFKFWDKCSNGWYDPVFGDEPIEGWYMELYSPTGELLESGYTDEYGYINWTVCAAGTYIVVEEDRQGVVLDPRLGRDGGRDRLHHGSSRRSATPRPKVVFFPRPRKAAARITGTRAPGKPE